MNSNDATLSYLKVSDVDSPLTMADYVSFSAEA